MNKEVKGKREESVSEDTRKGEGKRGEREWGKKHPSKYEVVDYLITTLKKQKNMEWCPI